MSRIRWGILGTGGIARLFTRDLRRLRDAEVRAVASRTPERASAFAREHGVARAHTSYAELATDPDVDVVYVATTNDLHAEGVLGCLRAGKAVLCEKPFARDAAEARRMVAAARDEGRFCMEAMWSRFLPLMREVRRLVDDGAVGDVRIVSAQLGMALDVTGIPRLAEASLGGGALLDIGVYPLALASWFLGAPQDVAAHATIGPSGVDEQGVVALRYADGRLASIDFTFQGAAPSDAVIIGTRGYIHLRGPVYRPRAAVLTQRADPAAGRPRALLRRLLRRDAVRIHAPHAGHGYHYEAAEVMRCLRAGALESAVMPLDETVEIMESIDRIQAAWRRPAVTPSFIEQGGARRPGVPS